MTAAERIEHYPAIEDLRQIAKRRMPHFAWEYLDSGTGLECAVNRNREELDRVIITPKGLKGASKPKLKMQLFDKTYDLPFGIAPVGMSGLMWPGAEHLLANTAKTKNIPYSLSTVACETPETVGQRAGGNAWYQLYTFADMQINTDLLKRAADSGFSTLLITVDVPIPSMRERQRRAGLRVPPKITPKFLFDVAQRPAWAMATLKHGKPAFRTLEKYAKSDDMQELTKFISEQRIGGVYQWKDLNKFRDAWKGPIVIKGLLDVADAKKAAEYGMDGIVVSNHGGRQFDAAPASISVLPDIVQAVGGKTKVIFDSGVRTGLDILRATALGADFVMAGRPFLYGAAAMGQEGADHAVDILQADLENNMMQLGIDDIADLKGIPTQLK